LLPFTGEYIYSNYENNIFSRNGELKDNKNKKNDKNDKNDKNKKNKRNKKSNIEQQQ
ncbi:hypothetical protein C6P45_001091, partial [Maudiozyma exigua]